VGAAISDHGGFHFFCLGSAILSCQRFEQRKTCRINFEQVVLCATIYALHMLVENHLLVTDEIPVPRSRFKTVLVFSMLFAVLGAVVVFGYWTTFRRPLTTVILIRHTEKVIDPNNSDPDLSPAGQARAQELVRVLGDSGINAIYATQYKRTQQTVKPLADKLGLPINQINSKNTADLVARIRSQNSGQVVFVAGHNNSVPEIIAALGGPTYPVIPETEFDNLYIVSIYRSGKAKVVKLKYGSPSQ
jgi:broad specificity phosphatase PhoE